MAAYYNENDPYAAQWLRNLVRENLIARGDVDERSIVDVRADDLRGYDQCHFFAGIGGWSLALRLAGWPDDRPVWTGSCPCQPFSAAGAGKAADDERHLWPAWFPLIAELRPAIVFGEQVEAAIGWGWLDVVFADLEGEGYACGTAVLPACGIGAPHIRQRCWFVADADEGRSGRHTGTILGSEGKAERQVWGITDGTQFGGGTRELGNAEGCDRGLPARSIRQQDSEPAGPSETRELGNANGEREAPPGRFSGSSRTQRLRSPWSKADWIACRDGTRRPVELGTFPLAHGIPGRVGRLRAYGNAIVAQTAAEFIMAATTSITSPLRTRENLNE